MLGRQNRMLNKDARRGGKDVWGKRMGRWTVALLGAGALCFLTLFLIPLDLQGAQEDSRTYEVSYLNREETELKALQFTSSENDYEVILQELMRRLGDREKEGDGVALLPAGVQINTYSISGSLLEVEFSTDYNAMARPREFLARAGIVRTLLQVPGITSIRFRVGKKELKGSDGKAVGNMTWGDFLDLSESNAGSFRYDSFVLYYTDKDGKALHAETKNVYCRQNIIREHVMLEQLVRGPIMKGHYPTVSENTIVNSVVISDRVAHVDLSRAFIDYAQEVPGELAVASIVGTLVAGGNVDKVQILVAGDEHAVLGDVDLYQYFTWNADLVED